MAFQLVDDMLGIVGDPAVTGKSASSDVRAGKRSAPVVAALAAGTAGRRAELAALLADGPPDRREDDVRAAPPTLVEEAGGHRLGRRTRPSGALDARAARARPAAGHAATDAARRRSPALAPLSSSSRDRADARSTEA